MNISQELIDSFTVYMKEISDTDFIDLLENSTVETPDLVDFASIDYFNDVFKQFENKQNLSCTTVVRSHYYENILENRTNKQAEIDKSTLSAELFCSSDEYGYTSYLYDFMCNLRANNPMKHYSLLTGDGSGSLFEVTKGTENKNIQAKVA